MKFKEMVESYKALTEEQKENIKGYASVKTGDYGQMNCFILKQQGAPEWQFVSMSFLRESKSYDFKWAKVYIVAKPTIKEWEDGKDVFKWRGWFGKVIHISQVRAKDGTEAKF